MGKWAETQKGYKKLISTETKRTLYNRRVAFRKQHCPCTQKCAERHQNCQSACQKYKEYKVKEEEYIDIQKKDLVLINYVNR